MVYAFLSLGTVALMVIWPLTRDCRARGQRRAPNRMRQQSAAELEHATIVPESGAGLAGESELLLNNHLTAAVNYSSVDREEH
jgi:hypothetical protein